MKVKFLKKETVQKVSDTALNVLTHHLTFGLCNYVYNYTNYDWNACITPVLFFTQESNPRIQLRGGVSSRLTAHVTSRVA